MKNKLFVSDLFEAKILNSGTNMADNGGKKNDDFFFL